MSDTIFASEEVVQLERRSGVSRRQEEDDRRQEDIPVAEDRRKGERRKGQRRRQIDPTTCERDYTGDELEFMRALDEYKRNSRRMFPTCSEILEVVRSLGYVKLANDDSPREPEISTPQFDTEPAEV